MSAPRFAVAYRPEVVNDDLSALPRNMQDRILRAIERRLMTDPGAYGTRLRQSLSGLWKLRVGDYRVVYEWKGNAVTVWAIRHRKEVYPLTERRRGR